MTDVIVDAARFQRAITAIDAANAADPSTLIAGGAKGPKELVHGRMLTEWILRMRPDASESLLLAGRAHHIRRWESPRSHYPEGRSGYLRWRTSLYAFHAEAAAEILAREGYEAAVIERVGELIRKRGLGRDPEAQVLEDATCLVFLETQLASFSAKTDREKMIGILRKTWRKMGPAGREAALALPFDPAAQSLIAEALATP